jgi:hypothetical protein
VVYGLWWVTIKKIPSFDNMKNFIKTPSFPKRFYRESSARSVFNLRAGMNNKTKLVRYAQGFKGWMGASSKG